MNPRLIVHPAAPLVDGIPPAYHEWFNDDGSLWCSAHREPGGYRLRFPDLGDFLIRSEPQSIEALPTQEDEATLEQLHLNHVLPLALSHWGIPSFHGSAVQVEDCGIAFLGPSGRGKSTLAAGLARQGHRLLADDGLLLRPAKDGFALTPRHPSFRLWSDSRKHLFGDEPLETSTARFSDKQRIRADAYAAIPDRDIALRRAYFLGETDAATLAIVALTPAQAMMAWVANSFVLDPRDRLRLTEHFALIRRLADLGLAYRLDYPRDYHRLPELQRMILTHALQNARHDLSA